MGLKEGTRGKQRETLKTSGKKGLQHPHPPLTALKPYRHRMTERMGVKRGISKARGERAEVLSTSPSKLSLKEELGGKLGRYAET